MRISFGFEKVILVCLALMVHYGVRVSARQRLLRVWSDEEVSSSDDGGSWSGVWGGDVSEACRGGNIIEARRLWNLDGCEEV